MYFIFTSITFPSSHLFSELCELCGWQFPPRTPLRGISWGRQCPAANQKVAPSPWDQLQQLQRPRRQVVCLSNAETLRYLARAARKLLVCCLHPNQGHTGDLPTLPMSKSDCLGTLKQGVRTVSKTPKKVNAKRNGVEVGRAHRAWRSSTAMWLWAHAIFPFPWAVFFRTHLYCMLSSAVCTHSEQSFTRCPNSKHTADQSLSLPWARFLYQNVTHSSFTLAFRQINMLAHIRVLLNQQTKPLKADNDTLTLEHHYDTETCI